MKTELRSVYRSDEKGVAIFVTLILLFIVTIAGVTLLVVAGRDRIASSDMSAVRGVAEAANTALDACENQISLKSPLMLSVLNKYLKDKSYRWFFSTDSMSANKEKKISLGNGYSYSAEIMAYDTASNVLQVRGIGYGRSNQQKTVVAQYRLNGITKKNTLSISNAVIPRNAVYIRGDGRNFDQPFDIDGNVFVGTVFHINNTNNCRIRGYLKTGYYPDSLSSTDGHNIVIDSGAYFGTGLFNNNAADLTCWGKIAVEGNLRFPAHCEDILKIHGEGWFNGKFDTYNSDTSTKSINMYSNTINHSGSLLMNRVKDKKENKNSGKFSDLAKKVGLDASNDSAWGLDTTTLGLHSKALAIGKKLTAEKLNKLYDSCVNNPDCAESKLVNGYMVIHDAADAFELDTSHVQFKGKMIMLLRNGLRVSKLFFDMDSTTARILMIVTGIKKTQWELPSVNDFACNEKNQSFYGLIYLRDDVKVTFVNMNNYSINGAVHLAHQTTDWQLNSGEDKYKNDTIKFRFRDDIVREFVSMGIIKIPNKDGTFPSDGTTSPASSATLKLADFKIRPEMLSVSY